MKKVFFLALLFQSSFFLSQDLPDYLPTEGLLSWFPFNGTTEDKSERGYHATQTGASLTENRFKKQNSALSLSGIGSYISLEVYTEELMLSNNFTLSFWMNMQLSSNQNVCIFTKGDALTNEFSLSWTANQQLHFPGGESSLSPFVNYTYYGHWTHVVCQVENGNAILYLDGREVSSFPMGRFILSSNFPFVFGAMFEPGTNTPILNSCFRGEIDDIGIWKRVLSKKEIKALYKAKE